MTELNFEQKVVRPAMFSDNGDPIKDVLDDWEVAGDEEKKRPGYKIVTSSISYPPFSTCPGHHVRDIPHMLSR